MHDALIFLCLENVHKCWHVAVTSLEIWTESTNMSWCTDVLLNVLLKSGKSSQMCLVALTSRQIWKRFANVSWCTSFLLRPGKCLLTCHDALAFFRHLENCHSCVMMHGLFLGFQKTLMCHDHDELIFLCLENVHKCWHVAVTSLEIWTENH